MNSNIEVRVGNPLSRILWWWSLLLSYLFIWQEQRRNRMRDLPPAVPRDKVLFIWVTVPLIDEQIPSCFFFSENKWNSSASDGSPRSPCQSSFHSFLSDVFSSCSKAPVGRLCPTLILLPLTLRPPRFVSIWLLPARVCPLPTQAFVYPLNPSGDSQLSLTCVWRAGFFPLTSYLTFSLTLDCKCAFI